MKRIAARAPSHPRILNDTGRLRALSRQGMFALLVAVFCGVLFSGCASLGQFGMKQKAIPKADARNPAVEILAIWEPAEGRGDNGVPTRGFAGQVLFFSRQGASPVEVQGDLRIYLFDDRGSLAEQAKPIHQFDFQSDAWKGHVKMSALGPSYHVFIPYSRKDQDQARCSLRVRLKPSDGPVIYSETANVVLPGPTSESRVADDMPGGTENHRAAKTAVVAERETEKPFDNAAARKLISAGLQKKPAGTAAKNRGQRNIQPSAHDENLDPNQAVAMLELTQRGNELRAGRSGVSTKALLKDEDFFPEDDADNTAHGIAPLEEPPLEDAARIESPRKVVRLTPAPQVHRPSTEKRHALRTVALDEDERVSVENSPPAKPRSRHPLEDEEQ